MPGAMKVLHNRGSRSAEVRQSTARRACSTITLAPKPSMLGTSEVIGSRPASANRPATIAAKPARAVPAT